MNTLNVFWCINYRNTVAGPTSKENVILRLQLRFTWSVS